MGILDRDQGRVEEARKEFAEAVQICRELADKNPEGYRPYLGETLSNLGILDLEQGRPEEARKEFAKALQIFQSLAKHNSERYSANVMRVKKLLAELPNAKGP